MRGSYAINTGDALDRLLNPIAMRQKLMSKSVPMPTQTVRPDREPKIGTGRPFASLLRFLIVGGTVAAVLERRLGKEYDASERRLNEERATAGAAAEALDLRLASIDIGETDAGPSVLKVSATPAFSAFETATGARIAEAVIAVIESKVRSWQRIEPKTTAPSEVEA